MLSFEENTYLEINSLQGWVDYASCGGRIVDAVGFSDRYYNNLEKEGWLIPGECRVCNDSSNFWVDRLYSSTENPNWRERVVCVKCGFNCRMRYAIEQIRTEVKPGSKVYVTEFITDLFKEVNRHYDAVGSEFIPDVPSGTFKDGVRIEDVTSLSFADQSVDAVMTFDVLEHVPDYKKALSEFDRVLKPGGKLLLTAPFDLRRGPNLLRAEHVNGELVHHEPVEMHGDPMNPEGGILSYHTFGWELVDRITALGFTTVVRAALSPRYGYLGMPGPFIVATKHSATA